jgi:hypothetical protein
MLAIAWAIPAKADINEAKSLYAQGNFAGAAEQLRPEAEKGLAEAQRLLAQMYEAGQGVMANESLAWTWYRKAAILGDLEAMYRVGRLHETGSGVPQSFKEALKWYQRSARLGHAPSMSRLGRFYLEGKGAKTNAAQGITYIREAAMLGEAEAETLLEELNRKGLAKALPPQPVLPPADDQAAAILDDIEKLLSTASLTFAGKPFISGSGQGPWTVTLPRAEYPLSDQSRWLIGTVRVSVSKVSPEIREYRIVLPSRSRLSGPRAQDEATLTLASNLTTVVWSSLLEAPVRSDVSIEGIKLSEPKSPGFTLEASKVSGSYALTAVPGKNRHDSTESGTVIGLRVREAGQEALSIGRIEMTSSLKGLDLEGYKQFRQSFGSSAAASIFKPDSRGSASQQTDLIPALIGGMSFQLATSDVRLGSTGRGASAAAAGSLTNFSFGLSADDLDQAVSRLTGNFSLEGLALGDKEVKPLAPSKVSIRLAAEKLPLRDMTNQALASMLTMMSGMAAKPSAGRRETPTQTFNDLLATMTDAFTDAQSVLKIEKLEASGAEYDIDATGEFRLERRAPGGFTGNLLANLRGLDRLTGPDAEANLITGLFVALRDMAKTEPNQKGQETFDVRFLPTGEVMVNGKLWPAAIASSENSPVPLKPKGGKSKRKSQPSKP